MERAASMLAGPPDLQVVAGYLSHLLPVLRTNGAGAGDPLHSLQQLGLEPKVLGIKGVPEHTVASLYRALAAHAGAWQQLVASELEQLRQVLQQQGGPALHGTIQILNGPILAQGAAAGAGAVAGAAAVGLAGAAGGTGKDDKKASVGDASGSRVAAKGGAAGAAAGGEDPVANDFAAAYAAMKEMLEIKLRHEAKRGDFLDVKLREAEACWKDVAQQLEVAHMQSSHLRNDCAGLHTQLVTLRQEFATSQAELAGVKEQLEARTAAWATEKEEILISHQEQVAGLRQELEVASESVGALKESQHQVEALRLLYNQELARASRATLDMHRAQVLADTAAQQEETWRRQLLKSDSRVGHAEGLTAALNAQTQQLADDFAESQEQLAQARAELDYCNLTLERNGVAAVQYRAQARAHMRRLGVELDKAGDTARAAVAASSVLEDSLRIKTLELDGAKAQLMANRGHLKQLMSDLEGEQDKTAALNNTLGAVKGQLETVTAAKDVAEARVKQLQSQLVKANEASAQMATQMEKLKEVAEERVITAATLQQKLEAVQASEAELQAQVSTMQETVMRLCTMEEELACLRSTHNRTLEEVERLTSSNTELQRDADELVTTAAALKALQAEHEASMQVTIRSSAKLRETEAKLSEKEKQLEEANTELDELGSAYDELEQEAWELEQKVELMSQASQNADAKVLELNSKMESLQTLLDQNDADRQQLAAQRDGWMSSYQEAVGKLQELTASSHSTHRHLLTRMGALALTADGLSRQVAATADATTDWSDKVADAAKTEMLNTAAANGAGSRPSTGKHGSTMGGAGGSRPGTATSSVMSATISSTAAAAAALEEGSAKTKEHLAVLQADAAGVVEQLAALRAAMSEQANKQEQQLQEVLQALSEKVQQRHQLAQDAWQTAFKAAVLRKAKPKDGQGAGGLAGRRIAAAARSSLAAAAAAGSGLQAALGSRLADIAKAAVTAAHAGSADGATEAGSTSISGDAAAAAAAAAEAAEPVGTATAAAATAATPSAEEQQPEAGASQDTTGDSVTDEPVSQATAVPSHQETEPVADVSGEPAPAADVLVVPQQAEEPAATSTPEVRAGDDAQSSAAAEAGTSGSMLAEQQQQQQGTLSRPRSRAAGDQPGSPDRVQSPSGRPKSSHSRPGTSPGRGGTRPATTGGVRPGSAAAAAAAGDRASDTQQQPQQQQGGNLDGSMGTTGSMRPLRRRASMVGAGAPAAGGGSLRASLGGGRGRRTSGIVELLASGEAGMFGVSAEQLLATAGTPAGSNGGSSTGTLSASLVGMLPPGWPLTAPTLPAAVEAILAALPTGFQGLAPAPQTQGGASQAGGAPAADAPATATTAAAAAEQQTPEEMATGVATALAAVPGLTQEAAAAALQVLIQVLTAKQQQQQMACGSASVSDGLPSRATAPSAAPAPPAEVAAGAGAAPANGVDPTAEAAATTAGATEASQLAGLSSSGGAAPNSGTGVAGDAAAAAVVPVAALGPAAAAMQQQCVQMLQSQVACLQRAYEQLRSEGQGRVAAANAQVRLQQSLVTQLQEQLATIKQQHQEQQQLQSESSELKQEPSSSSLVTAEASSSSVVQPSGRQGPMTATEKGKTAASIAAAAAAAAARAVGGLVGVFADTPVSPSSAPGDDMARLLPAPAEGRWGGTSTLVSARSADHGGIAGMLSSGKQHTLRTAASVKKSPKRTASRTLVLPTAVQQPKAETSTTLMPEDDHHSLQQQLGPQPSAEGSGLLPEQSSEAVLAAAPEATKGSGPAPSPRAQGGQGGVRALGSPASRRVRANSGRPGSGMPAAPSQPTSCLAGMVALTTYQAQVKATSELQQQMGVVCTQLREAQAATESVQDQLLHERQEHAARTTALRSALANTQEALSELRSDHEVLQQAHSRLMAKDLMKSGLLKDRYVADLFGRLQEAEWKLGLARRRAATWGQPLLVPMGRINRGIQTEIGEIWAMGEASGTQDVAVGDLVTGGPGALTVLGGVTSDVGQEIDSPRRQHGATGVQDTVSSSLVRRKALSPLPMELSSKTTAKSVLPQLSSGMYSSSRSSISPHGNVPRVRAAFTVHDPSTAAETLPVMSSTSSVGSTAELLKQLGEAPWLPAAERVIDAADVPVLSGPVVLMLIAHLYSTKARYDAAALASKQPLRPMWQIAAGANLLLMTQSNSLLKQQQHTTAVISAADIDVTTDADTLSRGGAGASEATLLAVAASEGSAAGCTLRPAALVGLSQLLASCQHHAKQLPEVSRFLQVLHSSANATAATQQQQQQQLLQQHAAQQAASQGVLVTTQRPTSPSVPSVVQSDTWWSTLHVDWNKRRPASVAQLLLPPPLAKGLARLTAWPGMLPLLQWVSSGDFMEEMRDNDLGQPLQDVQAPHIHFALLEAADILGISPLPIIHLLPVDTTACHLLRIPSGWAAHASTSTRQRQQQQQKGGSEGQDYAWSRQALLLVGRGVLRCCNLPQLQVLLAAALGPLAAPGGSGRDAATQKAPSNAEEEICLADVATLAALLTVQPRVIQRHARRHLQHAMGASMVVALRSAARMAAVSGDRGAMLVSQDVLLALGALLKANSVAAQLEQQQGAPVGVAYWIKEAVQQQSLEQWNLAQLLPQHPAEAGGASSGGGPEYVGKATGGGPTLQLDPLSLASVGSEELTDDQVLLLRVFELTSWASSPQYAAVMGAATPLRRVLPPPSKRQLGSGPTTPGSPLGQPSKAVQQQQQHTAADVLQLHRNQPLGSSRLGSPLLM